MGIIALCGLQEVSAGMRAEIRCHCGHRILLRDIVRRGAVARSYGQPMVYIRYRCPHCKQLGEQYIRLRDWNPSVLEGVEIELTEEERKRFDAMGPISDEEVARVRRSRSDLNELQTRD